MGVTIIFCFMIGRQQKGVESENRVSEACEGHSALPVIQCEMIHSQSLSHRGATREVRHGLAVRASPDAPRAYSY